MPHSMTAYAQRAESTPWGDVTCELRSVNHRYLEISPRLSDELRQLEPGVRDLIARRIKRGRVDCTLRFKAGDQWSDELELNLDRVRRMLAVAQIVHDQGNDMQPLRVIDVMRWPGVIQQVEVDPEQLESAARRALDTALQELVVVRAREGGRLRDVLRDRFHAMEEVITAARSVVPAANTRLRERVEERLREIKDELDPSRLEQEIVLYIQRTDVAEEVDRLRIHLAEVREVVERDEPVGRRLDFLMQEMQREANTLGAKSVDMELTQASVDLKVLIDQVREQVQNIE